jgi:hypothetical protein
MARRWTTRNVQEVIQNIFADEDSNIEDNSDVDSEDKSEYESSDDENDEIEVFSPKTGTKRGVKRKIANNDAVQVPQTTLVHPVQPIATKEIGLATRASARLRNKMNANHQRDSQIDGAAPPAIPQPSTHQRRRPQRTHAPNHAKTKADDENNGLKNDAAKHAVPPEPSTHAGTGEDRAHAANHEEANADLENNGRQHEPTDDAAKCAAVPQPSTHAGTGADRAHAATHEEANADLENNGHQHEPTDDATEPDMPPQREPRRRNIAGAGTRQSANIWRWNKCQQPFIPKAIPVTPVEKINVPFPDNPNECDFFDMYVTDDVINLMVRETNRYAKQYIEENKDTLKTHSNTRDWQDTNFNEMKTFLGMLILMGLVYKPRIAMYWAQDSLIETPIFSQLMTRNRFLLLTKFLHFSNNDEYDAGDPGRDKIFKIREVTNLLVEQWRTVYTPGKYLCVDESLIAFKGRLSFKQYIRTKRSRFGVKFYTLSTSNGISLDNLIYCGNLDAELQEVDGFLTTERIPITLLQNHLHAGRVLYTDNYYTTPRLAKYLLDRDTHLVGTVRSNRKNFPNELAMTNIQRGSAMFYSCNENNLLAVKYRSHKDKSDGRPKVVHMLSTCHMNNMGNTNKRAADGSFIKKPKCVIEYNHNMGGVDKIDQQLHSIKVIRKSYKWYKKIFLRIILQSMLNSHKLYSMNGGKQDFLGFIKNVVCILLHSTPKLVRNPKIITQDSLLRLTGHNHFPTRRLLPEESVRQKAYFKVKNCRVCSARGVVDQGGRPIRTPWVCQDCPGEPGLHIDKDCFRIYHTKLNYSQ